MSTYVVFTNIGVTGHCLCRWFCLAEKKCKITIDITTAMSFRLHLISDWLAEHDISIIPNTASCDWLIANFIQTVQYRLRLPSALIVTTYPYTSSNGRTME